MSFAFFFCCYSVLWLFPYHSWIKPVVISLSEIKPAFYQACSIVSHFNDFFWTNVELRSKDATTRVRTLPVWRFCWSRVDWQCVAWLLAGWTGPKFFLVWVLKNLLQQRYGECFSLPNQEMLKSVVLKNDFYLPQQATHQYVVKRR